MKPLFALICWGSIIAFFMYWWKQRKARLNAGESYQTDEIYLNSAKRKKQIGIVFITSLILYISPKLLLLIGIVAFFAFLYYWRKKVLARKEAGDNYMQDERYLHISKMKRILGAVCAISLILGIIIPNNSVEQQNLSNSSTKHETKQGRDESPKYKKEAEKQAKSTLDNTLELAKAKGGKNWTYKIEKIYSEGDLYYVDYKMGPKNQMMSGNMVLKRENNKWKLEQAPRLQ